MATNPDSLTQDEVIRRKLIADGDGSGEDRRLQSFLKSVVALCSSDEFNHSEDEAAFYRLMQQLQQLEYTAKRTHAAILMNEDSKNVYASLDATILQECQRTKGIIVEAKQVVEEETRHRKHSLEYEALCKLIESKPDRKATEERRNELEQTVKKYTELRKDLAGAVDNRERQVKSLGFVIESLKNEIESEDNKLWGGGSPLGDISAMDVDSFPLEKEQFPLLTVESSASSPVSSQFPPLEVDPPGSSSPVGQLNTLNESSQQISSPTTLSNNKTKYDELSEESPEEGESED